MIKSRVKPIYTVLLLLVLCLGVSTVNFAQNTKAVLQFKDGTTKTGLGKIVGNKVKFKMNKYDKAIKYSFTLLDSVKIHSNIGQITYVGIKVKGYEEPIVLQPIRRGKVNLYQRVTVGYNPGFVNSGFGGGMGYTGAGYNYSFNDFYVKKQGEAEAFHLGSNQLFTKNFKEAASDFFKDCPELVKKIEDKEFKKKQLKEIVEFYNNQCN